MHLSVAILELFIDCLAKYVMGKLKCLGGTLPDRKFIYHACLLLLHWQDSLLIRSQTEHSDWICNCPLWDTVRALLCFLIIIQSKLVVDKMIIMTIRCGSIPCRPQESHSVMLAARAGFWGEQNQGRAKVFTGKHQQDGGAFIQREEPGLPGDRADNRFIVSSMHMLWL